MGFSSFVKCFIVAVTLCCISAVRQCTFPPSVWCSSEQIAEICQVTDQCHKYVWNVPSEDAKDVEFTLYMESLCSDCKNFFARQLWPTWEKVGQIMNLTIVPYGNAMEVKSEKGWNFTCQHGPEECLGNIIETCSIYTVRNVSVYFPFIHCLEQTEEIPSKSYVKCAQKFGIDVDMIKKCAFGPYGNSLEHEMAELTNKLVPPHTFVPWVTLNGIHTKEIQDQAEKNLLKLICDTYKGPRPASCPMPSRHSSMRNQPREYPDLQRHQGDIELL